MNEEKLKELEEFCKKFNAIDFYGRLGDANTGVLDADKMDGAIVRDLISYVRQLEKEKAENLQIIKDYPAMCNQQLEVKTELLAALKYVKAIANRDPKNLDEAEIALAKVFRKALYTFNKHSTDTGGE